MVVVVATVDIFVLGMDYSVRESCETSNTQAVMLTPGSQPSPVIKLSLSPSFVERMCRVASKAPDD